MRILHDEHDKVAEIYFDRDEGLGFIRMAKYYRKRTEANWLTIADTFFGLDRVVNAIYNSVIGGADGRAAAANFARVVKDAENPTYIPPRTMPTGAEIYNLVEALRNLVAVRPNNMDGATMKAKAAAKAALAQIEKYIT